MRWLDDYTKENNPNILIFLYLLKIFLIYSETSSFAKKKKSS